VDTSGVTPRALPLVRRRVLATALLVLFWFFVADGSGGFIYTGF